MHIAVTANGENLKSTVSDDFEKAEYLLIVDMPGLEFEAVKNEGLSKDKLAEKIIEYDCEAVITGKIDPDCFEILAGEGITRYLGTGHKAEDALRMMEDYALNIIRNSEGTDICQGDHH